MYPCEKKFIFESEISYQFNPFVDRKTLRMLSFVKSLLLTKANIQY